MEISNLIWLNGKIVDEHSNRPSIASHSLNYGVGIFDGIMAYYNDDHYYLHYASDHYRRFLNSSHKLGFQLNLSVDYLINETYLLLDVHSTGKYYIRPIVFRPNPHIALTGDFSNAVENLAIILMKIADNSVKRQIKCTISPYERISGKSIPVQWKICAAYTNSYFARNDAEKKGYDDAIMLNKEGYICEASAANIFFIRENNLYTPLINNDIFPGITMKIICELASLNSIGLIQRDIHYSEIKNFEGCFLCATLMEITPVGVIDDCIYNTTSITLFNTILSGFKKIVSQ